MSHSIDEQLAALQAQATVQNMVLRALVRSHADPAAVLAAWRGLRADAVAASYGVPADGNRRHLVDCIHAAADEWTGELEDLAFARRGVANPA